MSKINIDIDESLKSLGEDIKINTIIGIVIILISYVITFTGNQTKTKSSKMLHEDDAA